MHTPNPFTTSITHTAPPPNQHEDLPDNDSDPFDERNAYIRALSDVWWADEAYALLQDCFRHGVHLATPNQDLWGAAKVYKAYTSLLQRAPDLSLHVDFIEHHEHHSVIHWHLESQHANWQHIGLSTLTINPDGYVHLTCQW